MHILREVEAFELDLSRIKNQKVVDYFSSIIRIAVKM